MAAINWIGDVNPSGALRHTPVFCLNFCGFLCVGLPCVYFVDVSG